MLWPGMTDPVILPSGIFRKGLPGLLMLGYASRMTTNETPEVTEDNRRELTAEELALTQAKVAKINDRAASRGWTGRLAVETEATEVTEENEAGIEITKVIYRTRITGEAPRYDGWTFLAVLDWHSAGGELITRCAPGVGVIDRSNLRPGECDQCGTTRDRKDIYLVRHQDGTTFQVGSTCLKDFMGWTAVPSWISQDDTDDMFESAPGGGRWVDYDVKTVLAVAWALIKRDGFHPASFDNPTKYDVLRVLEPGKSERDRQFAREARPLVASAQAQADQIRAYILSDDFQGDSEYVVNLKVSCRASHVTARAFGLVVSAPQAWARAVERDLTRRAQAEQVCNEWIGQEKDRIELAVVVKSIRPIESYYGVTYLYTMADEAGHVIKWFSSSQALGDDVTGEQVTLKATIKELSEYQGTKQTVITRAKVL